MVAGTSPGGINMPQQPQGYGVGGGRGAFGQQLMNIPGFADSLQASQQRMAQDPNANMMRTQPALPAGYDPNVPQRGFGVMVQPSQAPSQPPAGMQGDQLRMQQDQQMSMDALNQARQAGFQVGPTPNQVPNPFASMSIPQRQQMNEQMRMEQMRNDQIRMQQMMQQQQMPFQMQPQMNNPMFGGLGGLMAMRSFGGGFGQPMGGGFGFGYSPPQFGGGFGGGFGRGFGGGYAPPQFGGGGFSQPQMGNPFSAAMGRGLGGLMGFFR